MPTGISLRFGRFTNLGILGGGSGDPHVAFTKVTKKRNLSENRG